MSYIKNNYERKVAIIGFGAGGLTFFVQAIDRLLEKKLTAAIHIYEPSEMGLGKAYATDSQHHILNLDTHSMSVVHGKPNHFHNWFITNRVVWQAAYPDISEDDPFPPRGVFGMYLKDVYRHYLHLATSHGIEVYEHRTQAADIRETDGSLTVIDSDEGRMAVDVAVLALGNMPTTSYEVLKQYEGYYIDTDPWIKEAKKLRRGDIGIIGTRLTAIDTALQLGYEIKPSANITLLSRTGKLPKVIGPGSTYTLKHLTPRSIESRVSPNGYLALADLVDLFKREIDHATGQQDGWRGVISQRATTLAELQAEIALVEGGTARTWQAILIEFYPHVPSTWNLLSGEDKKTFLAQFQSLWLTYLAAFPLKNAQKIADLWVRQIIDVKGGVLSIDYDKQRQKFIVRTVESESQYDILIDATGASHCPFETSSLLASMEAGGLVARSSLGDVAIDPQTCVAQNNRAAPGSIYAIGEITFGSWLATSDIGQISRQAEKAVSDLFGN